MREIKLQGFIQTGVRTNLTTDPVRQHAVTFDRSFQIPRRGSVIGKDILVTRLSAFFTERAGAQGKV